MAYNEVLAQRVREVLANERGLIEIKMFGGLAFMLRGNMSIGVLKDELIVRVGPKHYFKNLKKKYTRPFDLTGRPLTGFIYVNPAGLKTAKSLKPWVMMGANFAKSLPAK